jgi:CubicO group peptidase (beta-lactamase class C family)
MTASAGGLDRVRELVRSRQAAAQLCVVQDGRVVLHEVVGCPPDALFWTFSVSKPFVAMLVHLLAERGELSLDDPVARHWPEFGQRGKAAITIRHVLAHRSGLAQARGILGDALAMTSWERSRRNIELAQPRWAPGAVPAYQPIIFGFILGEVVRRVSGTEVPALLRREILGPVGLADTHLGLPDALWPRHVPLRARGADGWISQAYLNRRATRRAVIPSAGISTTAADLARFYQAVLDNGELDGVRVLPAAAVAEARRPAGGARIDPATGVPARWAQGFRLAYPEPDPQRPRSMGQGASSETFGHNGSNCCLAWADPTRRLVVAYVTSVLPRRRGGTWHFSAVSDAILQACS